jgi:hypothetical protein
LSVAAATRAGTLWRIALGLVAGGVVFGGGWFFVWTWLLRLDGFAAGLPASVDATLDPVAVFVGLWSAVAAFFCATVFLVVARALWGFVERRGTPWREPAGPLFDPERMRSLLFGAGWLLLGMGSSCVVLTLLLGEAGIGLAMGGLGAGLGCVAGSWWVGGGRSSGSARDSDAVRAEWLQVVRSAGASWPEKVAAVGALSESGLGTCRDLVECIEVGGYGAELAGAGLHRRTGRDVMPSGGFITDADDWRAYLDEHVPGWRAEVARG